MANQKPKNSKFDYSSFDLVSLVRRLKVGKASKGDKVLLASFSGTFLRNWQDERLLKDSGIIQK